MTEAAACSKWGQAGERRKASSHLFVLLLLPSLFTPVVAIVLRRLLPPPPLWPPRVWALKLPPWWAATVVEEAEWCFELLLVTTRGKECLLMLALAGLDGVSARLIVVCWDLVCWADVLCVVESEDEMDLAKFTALAETETQWDLADRRLVSTARYLWPLETASWCVGLGEILSLSCK